MKNRTIGLIFSLLATATVMTAQNLVIRNVTIHPVTSADIEHGSVAIENGRITAVGLRVATPHGAQILNGAGLHLYPGLINAATNIGLEEIEALRDTVDLDEIGAFNPELRAEVAFNPTSEHIPVTRAAGITTVVSLPGSGARSFRAASGLILGQGAVMHLEGWTWEQMAVKRGAVMDVLFPETESIPPQMAAFLGTQGRSWSDLDRERKAQIRRMHEFFEQARQYATAKKGARADFRKDVRLEAMIPVLTGKLPMMVRAAKEQTIKDAVQFADEEQIKIILADPIEIGSAGPLLKQKNIPVILGETFRLPTRDDDPYDAPYTLPGEYFKAGVKLCFGTFDVQFARNVPFQAAQAVAFGLPRAEALKALTINSAQILGVGDQIGSIEKGKIADLILTDGDPLEARTTVKKMFIAGKLVSLESRHTREYEKWIARP